MPLQTQDHDLVLASRSPARLALLANAGIALRAVPADLDEQRLRAEMGKVGAGDIAAGLALAKALHVSASQRGALVIGADQVLALDDDILSKPEDRVAAERQLARLGGKKHILHSACACVRDGEVLWQCVDSANLTMRPLSANFIARYLDMAGDGVLQCVGAYQLEGPGVHLFSAIEGDYFTVLGLPLLPLLAFLRQQGVIFA